MSPGSSVALSSRLKCCDLLQRITFNSFSLSVSASQEFPLGKLLKKIKNMQINHKWLF